MRELLAPYGVAAHSAGELGLAEPEETGTTFAANARIKAQAAAKATGRPAFADDSGLVVDALDGEPGIHSARWAGPDKDFRAAMNRIETLLIERGARRRRSAARISSRRCASPGPTAMSRNSRAASTASLVWPPRGDAGFGYDPMFLPDGFDRTFGEMSARGETRPAAEGPRPVASRARLRQTRGGVPALKPPIVTILISCPQRE